MTYQDDMAALSRRRAVGGR